MKMNILSVVFMTASLALGHGGDEPGPHGGFIEMPGAFHVEVVPEKDNSFKVYLIDINFENPTVKESSVEAWTENGSKKSQLNCEVKENYFHCSPTAKVSKDKTLVVKAKREKMQGNEARYKLPLKRK